MALFQVSWKQDCLQCSTENFGKNWPILELHRLNGLAVSLYMFVTILVAKWDQWTNLVPTHVNWSATNTLHHWVTANTPFHIWQAKISKLQESKRKKKSNQIKSRSYIKQCWYLTEKMSRLATLAATHLGSAQHKVPLQSPNTKHMQVTEYSVISWWQNLT